MSNLPELLRTKAEGLRKEAEEQVRDAEVAFYAAQELVKKAVDETYDYAHRTAMLEMARRQAEAAEKNGKFSAANARISRLSPEDMTELKAKLSAIEGANKAFGSARESAPVSTGLRAVVGAGVGAVGGALLGSPIFGAAVGAGIGGISGAVAKDKYAFKNYGKDEHRAIGETARDHMMSRLTNTDVERKITSLAEHYNPSYPVEDKYDETHGASTFYKKACLETLQGLVNDGQIDPDVAIATAQELERRLA